MRPVSLLSFAQHLSLLGSMSVLASTVPFTLNRRAWGNLSSRSEKRMSLSERGVAGPGPHGRPGVGSPGGGGRRGGVLTK